MERHVEADEDDDRGWVNTLLRVSGVRSDMGMRTYCEMPKYVRYHIHAVIVQRKENDRDDLHSSWRVSSNLQAQ